GVVMATHPLAGMALAQLSAACGLLTLMVAFYAWPALLLQQGGIRGSLRIALALVVGQPFATTGFMATALGYSVLMLTPPGVALVSTLPLVTLACCAYELHARCYGDGPALCDEDDIYLNRGFREFLFPWKG